MHGRSWSRTVAAIGALALWVPATAFFAIVALRVAQLPAGPGGVGSSIADAHGVMVTAGYSLGGAAIGLGIAWLALPAGRRLGLQWATLLWIAVTALLLFTRQVSGWPLLVASLVALGIGLDVNRRLLFAAFARPANNELVSLR